VEHLLVTLLPGPKTMAVACAFPVAGRLGGRESPPQGKPAPGLTGVAGQCPQTKHRAPSSGLHQELLADRLASRPGRAASIVIWTVSRGAGPGPIPIVLHNLLADLRSWREGWLKGPWLKPGSRGPSTLRRWASWRGPRCGGGIAPGRLPPGAAPDIRNPRAPPRPARGRTGGAALAATAPPARPGGP
jgi:hypothetical protein